MLALRSNVRGIAFVAALSSAWPNGAAAQSRPVSDSGRGADPALRGLRWRPIGPYRGGRAVAVTGDLTKPYVFYFGSVDGGVWKTVNAGQSWQSLSDGRADIGSVGAIAVAPSDPNVIYVGSGEADFREDLTHGDGMYRSTDGGESWQHIGLEDARHIAIVRVDPKDADVAYVAAMGHAFGPNAMRGIFRTRDGGKSWKRVLFIDDSTGAIDLALDPTNSRILYASMWRFRRSPWGMSSGGGRSGLFKSTDAGDSWSELTDNAGLPDGPFGRIGITVSPVVPSRLWASIEAKDSAGGIFRSDDGGRSWQRTTGDQKFAIRPWYYSQLTADPVDENTVYVMNLDTWRSVDGGKTFSRLHVPHGDDHELWIDPRDPKRMIEGNDGGATVSLDRGESWSSQLTQPTAQFYHVIADDGFPYRVYGAQQDNTPVSVASRSDEGAITGRDWWPIGGGEAGYVAVQPGDPPVTYVGDYMGTIIRYDRRSEQRRDVSVWQNNWDGHPAADAPYRFQWTFPIVTSPHDPRVLYAAGNRVFRSNDEGQHWEPISPDLTVHDPATIGPVGLPMTKDMTGTEWYATVFAFAESPVVAGVLWAGSDDGLVHVSRDGGKSWQTVTPAAGMLGKFTRISIIEPSHYDAGTAYLAANRYQQDDYRPYLLKTTDYGRSWTPITAGLPGGSFMRVIREDPVRRGLLFAGAESGAYVSFDDGARWEPLQLNLPHTSVRDLAVHGSDLIAATHGRSFWVIDDISILRQLADSVRHAGVFVVAPQPAIRYAGGRSLSAAALQGYARTINGGQNPQSGLMVDYYLREKPRGDVVLTLLDSAGRVIRTFTSDTTKKDSTKTAGADSGTAKARGGRDTTGSASRMKKIEAGLDSTSYAARDSVMSARAGGNRFVWDLRHPGAKVAKDILLDEGGPAGPVAVPGRYSLRLSVDGQTVARPFTVVPDPRLKTSQADYLAQFALTQQIIAKVTALVTAGERIQAMQRDLAARTAQTKGQSFGTRVAASADSLSHALEAVRRDLIEVDMHAGEASLFIPVKAYNQLLTLNAMVQSADAGPTQAEVESFADLNRQVDTQLAKLTGLEMGQVAAFNRMMRELDVPAVGVGVANGVKAMVP